MIYIDTSVALAHIIGEGRHPRVEFWSQPLISSRLLEYEAWTRIHAYGLAKSHGELLRELIRRIAFVRLDLHVLERACEPFPKPVRTLDAIHLAALNYLLQQGQSVALASYDDRLIEVARLLGWSIHDPD